MTLVEWQFCGKIPFAISNCDRKVIPEVLLKSVIIIDRCKDKHIWLNKTSMILWMKIFKSICTFWTKPYEILMTISIKKNIIWIRQFRCGFVGREVTSNTRNPRLESSHMRTVLKLKRTQTRKRVRESYEWQNWKSKWLV